MKTDFKTSNFLSSTGRFICSIFFFVGVIVITASPLLGMLICVICAVLFATHYRLAIDTEQKTFYDYCWIAGVKSGSTETYEEIQYFYIKRNKITQVMHSRVSSASLQTEVFDAYLNFSDNKKVHLFTASSKEKAEAKLKKLAAMLNVNVVEYADQSR